MTLQAQQSVSCLTVVQEIVRKRYWMACYRLQLIIMDAVAATLLVSTARSKGVGVVLPCSARLAHGFVPYQARL
jgi:hypothetical protein